MSTSTAELRRIAARYSAALFSLASEKGKADEVKADLDQVAAAMTESESFTRLLISPILSRESQAKGVAAVMDAFKASKLTKDFFQTLSDNRRLNVTEWVVRDYAKLVAESRNETTAEVISAYPLTKEQLKALEASMVKATGRASVTIETRVNPEILGGVVVKVDGKMFDNSIATKIQRLSASLKVGAQSN